MTKYISVLQLKGGVGKSTLSAFMAGYLLSKGHFVLTVDADMQQATLTSWTTLFANHKHAKNHQHATAHDLEELLSILQLAWEQAKFDYVIIDAPPRIAEVMRALVFSSDIVLMPLAISSPDIWAMEDTVKIIKKAMEEKPDLNVKLVFNRMKDTSSYFKIRNAVIEDFELPYVQQILSEFESYKTIFGKGTHPLDYHLKKPKEQFNAFAKEVMQSL